MKRPIQSKAVVVAALAGLSTVALAAWSIPVRAQYLQQTGHANDANHQIGSGGYNYPSSPNRINNNLANTDIITGNSAGLNYFHGNNNGEFNQNTFAGVSATSNSDRLNAIAGPTAGGAGGTHYQTSIGPGATPFYSQSTFTGNAPAGLALVPNSSSNQYLVPAPRIDPLTPTADVREDPGLNLNTNPAVGNIPLPGELDMLGGPVDPSGAALVYSMSPLYGVREMQSGSADDSFYQSKFGASRPLLGGFDNSRAAQIQRMRDELNNPGLPSDQQQQQQPGNTKPVPGAVPLSQAPLSNSVGVDASVTATQLNNSVSSQQLNGSLNSGQGMQNSVLLPPSQQSDTLKKLEQQYSSRKGKLTPDEQTQRFNAEQRAQASKNTSGLKPGVPDSSPANPLIANGVGNDKPLEAAAPTQSPKPILNGDGATPDNKPMIITSLADGIRFKSLAAVMKTAEEKLRQGKFTEAVASYEMAQQAAPNNPFVYLGRSFAELGSSYYGKADLDLRRAVLLDPAVLAGRYDLNGFMGQDRVSFVQKELTGISSTEKGGRAPMLLAFMAHNTGDDAAAAKNLDEAVTRGGYAGLVDEMRTAWGIKTPAK